MSGYWKNYAQLSVGSSGQLMAGKKHLTITNKRILTKKKWAFSEFSDISVKPLGKDYAFVFGKWNLI